ncbi:MAG: transcription elongation factor GreA [Eubacteriales bacterium]|nr:transcription elongation factor GreA [Eubacteriales bacterium]
MANDMVILTEEGLKAKQEKLDFLKTVRRAEISEQIKEARAFGDLSENAEYDEAKNEQAKVETEIAQLEKLLRNAVVLDDNDVDLSTVNIGTTVRILDMEFGEEEEYHIVGSVEADADKKRISNESPVGSALLGKKAGDIAEVSTPAGTIRFKVIDIHK